MRAEAESSILQQKFREWFENSIPGTIPLSDEADCSVENIILGDPHLIAETNHRTRKRREARKNHVVNSAKLLELLFFGFIGAVSFGSGVGIIILITNLNFEGWYNNNWPSQFIVILIAAVIGFNIGLSSGYTSLQRKRYF